MNTLAERSKGRNSEIGIEKALMGSLSGDDIGVRAAGDDHTYATAGTLFIVSKLGIGLRAVRQGGIVAHR